MLDGSAFAGNGNPEPDAGNCVAVCSPNHGQPFLNRTDILEFPGYANGNHCRLLLLKHFCFISKLYGKSCSLRGLCCVIHVAAHESDTIDDISLSRHYGIYMVFMGYSLGCGGLNAFYWALFICSFVTSSTKCLIP
jgi:hypothetical protein